MIHSFVFSDGKLVSRDLEIEALRLVNHPNLASFVAADPDGGIVVTR